MDINWLVLVFFSGFISVHCKNCDSDTLEYLAQIDIIWDEESELVHHGIGSLIHPDYVITAGSFVFDYHKVKHDDDSKYPLMEVEFLFSEHKNIFKVQEVIIMEEIYDSETSDFALIKLETRPKFTAGYMRAAYIKPELTLSNSKQYYLGTADGIINISPTDPDSVISSPIIDTTSELDNFVYDNRVGAPLLFCDQDRGHYVQAGIFSSFDTMHAHQRNTNLLMLTETIYDYIAEQDFKKCYKKHSRRINDGETRFHNRAHLGDSIVHIFATTYSTDGKPSQRRCSGSFATARYIITSATCVLEYIAERKKSFVKPELYDTTDDMKYKMMIVVGFEDEVNHPNAIINEKDIEDVKLQQHQNPETGVADMAVITLVEDINKLVDKSKFIGTFKQ